MNYRHAFHAGNFADVMKHAILARLVLSLQRKEKAFRVIDTHAGRGIYDLRQGEAERTREWRDGIGRLLDTSLPAEAAKLLRAYLATVTPAADGALRSYPGSPLIVRRLLRPQDRLTAIELHPADARALAELFTGDFQARVIKLDGWLALKSQLPPKEKRGLVLVDPPFEADGEFERLTEGLRQAHRRWPGGIYALWYPIKNEAAAERFREGLRASGVPDIIDVRFEVRGGGEQRLNGSGMIIVNPPFRLEDELAVILPALRAVLAQDEGAGCAVVRLAGERAAKAASEAEIE